MREGTPSLTAMFVAAARGAAGVDPFAARLVPRHIALVAVGLTAHLRLRTLAIDELVREDAAKGTVQIVILGAGLDARAWRLDATRDSVVFEVDYPPTQAFKRRRLGEARTVAREVVFVGVDFERDDLAQRLAESGHDASRPTTWIWEGVTPYLTAAAVDATLAVVGARSAAGSSIALTYVTPGYADVPRLVQPFVLPAFRVLGEPLRGLMTTDTAAATLRKHGLEPVRDDLIADLAARFSAPRPWRAIHERLVISERRSSS